MKKGTTACRMQAGLPADERASVFMLYYLDADFHATHNETTRFHDEEELVSFVPGDSAPDMMIDVVDHEDRKIGEAPRGEVLQAAVNFHTVHLFLFDSSGRLLLQQLGATRDRHPLTWGASVAAYLFAGETYEDGIRRRAFQELGVSVDPEPVGKIKMIDEKSTKFVSLFKAIYDGEINPDPAHIAAVRFVSLAHVTAEVTVTPKRFTPTFRKLLLFYLRSL
jgi:isopentenyl-diphosphate delta-isomerase